MSREEVFQHLKTLVMKHDCPAEVKLEALRVIAEMEGYIASAVRVRT